MSTFNGLYIHSQPSEEEARAAILGLYPEARIEVGEFVSGILSRDEMEPPEQALKEISAKLNTDVIWITFQTTAESFIFHHWGSGTQMRALWYGCANEGTWERVEGKAEPWEAEAFWSEDALESMLECVESSAEQKRIKQLWKVRVIRKGQSEPSVSSEDAAQAAMEYYGLLDEEVSPAPSISAEEAAKDQRRRNWGCVWIIVVLVALAVAVVLRVMQYFK